MFKLFSKKNEEEDYDSYYDAIDPVLEQRRKEKFSTPFLDDDDDEDEVVEVKKEPVKTKKSEVNKVEEPVKKPVYIKSQVISPTMGLKESKVKEVKVQPKPVKKKKPSDSLVPNISPISGPSDYVEEEPSQPTKLKKAKNKKRKQVKEETVEENMRNIAKLSEEGKEDLRIIEERTGEFKLDFGDNQDTFIDNINDDMSLEDLMSLYERKFKD